jgi:hypothetical protein
VLAGADAMRMIDRAKRMIQQGNGWANPFGERKAGELVLDAFRSK